MPAPRNRCCAITPAGSQCTRHTATDETLGRCKQHHTNSRLDEPATLAVREFEFFLYNNADDWNARIGLHFPVPAIEAIGARQIKETVWNTLRTWINANREAVRTFYAARAVGTKVDVTNFYEAYSTRVDETWPRVVAAYLANPRWGPVMRGEPAPAAPVFAPRAARVPRVPVGELAAFAADNQNVHTAQSVSLTKAVVERVLKIAVDKAYQWNRKTVSRTPAEIIWACSLHPQVAMQMMQKYCAADNVYEMGAGIYGRVLDGVYAYIKNSPAKKDLYKILRAELTDNLGMCAQGNLTRLCNVLAGYLEGIGSQESPADRLGRELPKLMEIEDETRRMDVARGVLRDTGLPEAEWAPWLEALA
jgi:hypothetical protein